MMLRDVLTTVIPILALLPVAYYIFAAVAARRFFTRAAVEPTAPGDGGFTPPVSVLKPVRGLDRRTIEHFTSICRQDYPLYEIIFAVADADDASIPVIRQLAAAYPERSIRLL